LEIGLRFVQSARNLTDASLRTRNLSFAQVAHNAVLRHMSAAPLTNDERIGLTTRLRDLQGAIDDWLDAVMD
jgi:hypothetical protein